MYNKSEKNFKNSIISIVAQWLERWSAIQLVSGFSPDFAMEIFQHEYKVNNSNVFGGFRV